MLYGLWAKKSCVIVGLSCFLCVDSSSETRVSKITKSSTAEYFAKNLQQVGFSSPLKAVLTTLKEAVDNSLDACEQEGILPEVEVRAEQVGRGTTKNTDLI